MEGEVSENSNKWKKANVRKTNIGKCWQ